MRAIFCGTPEIAVPSLEALAEIADIVGVVCQPDRPAGRGMRLRPPAVKVRALERGLDVHQPVKVRDGSLAEWMRNKDADLALVIAYGRILTAETLLAPRLGCVNLHASLLPEFRGAAPIQRAIMAGKTETGVCLMQMDEGMDTGDVLACRAVPIDPVDNAGTLAVKLAETAARLTRDEIPRFFRGELAAKPQDHVYATHAPPITKEDTKLNLNSPATDLVNQVRGLAPRPGAACDLSRVGEETRRLKVLQARVFSDGPSLDPGEVRWEGTHLVVGTADGSIEILSAQPEGKKPQGPVDLKNGRVLLDGDRLA